MNSFAKPIQAALLLVVIAILTGCTLGQAAEPTPTAVDVNAVMTSAASTAFAQLTEFAAQASPTSAPTETPAATATNSPSAGLQTATPTIILNVQITDTPPAIVLGASPTLIPSLTPAVGGVATQPVICKNSAFLADMTVPDGTVFKPWEKFYKVWRMQNTGVCAWDEGFYFAAWAGPPSMASKSDTYTIKNTDDFIQPGQSVDIGIKMYAPGDPGEYVAHWSWYDDTGRPFGQSVSVVIKVEK
jgi:hypothetical protein